MIFKLLYYLTSFFIFIGETTRRTIIFPYLLLSKALPKLPTVSIRVKYFIFGSFVTLLIVSANQSYLFIKSLPSPANIGKTNYPLSTHIYDRNGKLLYEIYHEQNRTPVSLKKLPDYVAQATIAIEDKDFYRHNGIALFSGIFRAVKEMVLHKNLQGG